MPTARPNVRLYFCKTFYASQLLFIISSKFPYAVVTDFCKTAQQKTAAIEHKHISISRSFLLFIKRSVILSFSYLNTCAGQTASQPSVPA